MTNQRWVTLSDLAQIGHPNLMLLHNACTTIIMWLCSATQYNLNQSQLSTVRSYMDRIGIVALPVPGGIGTSAAPAVPNVAATSAAVYTIDLTIEDDDVHNSDDEVDLGRNAHGITETQSESGSDSDESVIIIQGAVQASPAHAITEPSALPA